MTDTQVAIVTGGGTGIGKATAGMLMAEGFDVLITGRRADVLQAAAAEIHGSVPDGGTIEALAADMADPNDVSRIASAALDRWGRVDVLVNNAALGPMVSIPETSADLLEDVFRANVHGPAMLIAALWPLFKRQKSGCVVNVSSMATLNPFPGLSVYAASKAALESLTRSIINEGSEWGIRACSVAPGAVETPMLRALFDSSQIPRARTLDPAAVARVIVDCVLGRRTADASGVVRVPSP